jgi:hypothetical protein
MPFSVVHPQQRQEKATCIFVIDVPNLLWVLSAIASEQIGAEAMAEDLQAGATSVAWAPIVKITTNPIDKKFNILTILPSLRILPVLPFV